MLAPLERALRRKQKRMLTFILLGAGAIVILAAVFIAYGANQRKRAGQSGQASVNTQQTGAGKPNVGRGTGVD